MTAQLALDLRGGPDDLETTWLARHQNGSAIHGFTAATFDASAAGVVTRMLEDPTIRLLSLGAGVQSTVLALMAANGELPELDGAVHLLESSDSQAHSAVARREHIRLPGCRHLSKSDEHGQQRETDCRNCFQWAVAYRGRVAAALAENTRCRARNVQPALDLFTVAGVAA
jgi:hypothetical protein